MDRICLGFHTKFSVSHAYPLDDLQINNNSIKTIHFVEGREGGRERERERERDREKEKERVRGKYFYCLLSLNVSHDSDTSLGILPPNDQILAVTNSH